MSNGRRAISQLKKNSGKNASSRTSPVQPPVRVVVRKQTPRAPRNYHLLKRGNESLFVRRSEVWHTITTVGHTRYTFQNVDFPAWFGAISRLYETFQLEHITIRAIPAYNRLADGLLTISYNTNQTDPVPTSPAELLQQFRSRQSRISETTSITIPGSVFRGTPTARFTSGPTSYLFDLDVWVEATTAQSVTIQVSYGCLFRTPQPPRALTETTGGAYTATGTNPTTYGAAINGSQGPRIRVPYGETVHTNLAIQAPTTGSSTLNYVASSAVMSLPDTVYSIRTEPTTQGWNLIVDVPGRFRGNLNIGGVVLDLATAATRTFANILNVASDVVATVFPALPGSDSFYGIGANVANVSPWSFVSRVLNH